MSTMGLAVLVSNNFPFFLTPKVTPFVWGEGGR